MFRGRLAHGRFNLKYPVNPLVETVSSFANTRPLEGVEMYHILKEFSHGFWGKYPIPEKLELDSLGGLHVCTQAFDWH